MMDDSGRGCAQDYRGGEDESSACQEGGDEERVGGVECRGETDSHAHRHTSGAPELVGGPLHARGDSGVVAGHTADCDVLQPHDSEPHSGRDEQHRRNQPWRSRIHGSHEPATLRLAVPDVFPWVCHLSERELREFTIELAEVLSDAAELDAVRGWEELCRLALSNACRSFEALRDNPR